MPEEDLNLKNDLEDDIGLESETATQYQFSASEECERLDVQLATFLPEYSRSHLANLIGAGMARVGGKIGKPGMKPKAGEVIEISVPAVVTLQVIPQNIPLEIVHEDDDILVINKAKGMVVHPAPGNPDGTLVNALMHYCGDRLSDINGVIRPGIVHRIDKDTSGLLVVAKNNHAHKVLSEALHEHGVTRIYRAIVDGVIKTDVGMVDAPIGRHPKDRKKMAVNRTHGRRAITHYRVLRRFQAHTLMEFELETGRTHQIRVHMAFLGHPITGDAIYGTSCRLMNTEGQALHAKQLSFLHPGTNLPVSYESEVPAWMLKLLEVLERREG